MEKNVCVIIFYHQSNPSQSLATGCVGHCLQMPFYVQRRCIQLHLHAPESNRKTTVRKRRTATQGERQASRTAAVWEKMASTGRPLVLRHADPQTTLSGLWTLGWVWKLHCCLQPPRRKEESPGPLPPWWRQAAPLPHGHVYGNNLQFVHLFLQRADSR